MREKSVGIIGSGAFGKALHHVISQNTDNVYLFGRREPCDTDIVILAVPTQSLRDLRAYLPPDSENLIIINTAKGMERETHQLPFQIMKDLLPKSRYYTLMGPSFAEEMIRDMPTLVNIGYDKDFVDEKTIRSVLQTDVFRLRPTKGVEALELAACLKNIYAIGCGIVEGLGYETNTRVQLIVLAIEEVQMLFQRLSIANYPESVPGRIGDLVLTCNSSESRNFRFGNYLTKYPVQHSLDLVGAIVEGYHTILSLEALEKRAGIKLPLAGFIRETIEKNEPKKLKKRFEEFVRKT